MSDPTNVNPQIVDTINVTAAATTTPSVAFSQGAGKAVQSVAQSMAIAVQDASDNLRNIGVISATSAGVAMAQLLATGESKYATALEQAIKLNTEAANTFKVIGVNAADVLKGFRME